MRNRIVLEVLTVVVVVAIAVGLFVIKIHNNKKEKHNGLAVDDVITTSRVFTEVYGYNLTGKIRKFVYKEPGEETSLVAVVQREDVPIYLLRRKY